MHRNTPVRFGSKRTSLMPSVPTTVTKPVALDAAASSGIGATSRPAIGKVNTTGAGGLSP